MESTKSSATIEYCDQIDEEIYLYGDVSANSATNVQNNSVLDIEKIKEQLDNLTSTIDQFLYESEVKIKGYIPFQKVFDLISFLAIRLHRNTNPQILIEFLVTTAIEYVVEHE